MKVKGTVAEEKDTMVEALDGENGSQRLKCLAMSLNVKAAARKQSRAGAVLGTGAMARSCRWKRLE